MIKLKNERFIKQLLEFEKELFEIEDFAEKVPMLYKHIITYKLTERTHWLSDEVFEDLIAKYKFNHFDRRLVTELIELPLSNVKVDVPECVWVIYLRYKPLHPIKVKDELDIFAYCEDRNAYYLGNSELGKYFDDIGKQSLELYKRNTEDETAKRRRIAEFDIKEYKKKIEGLEKFLEETEWINEKNSTRP